MPDDGGAAGTGAKASGAAGDDDAPPPGRPVVRPTLRSLRLSPGDDAPPEFEVAAGDATRVWLEVSTDGDLLGKATSSSPDGPVVARGDEVAAEESTDDTPFPVKLALDREVWDRVRAKREVVRLWYRVGGRTDAGETLFSSDGDEVRPHFFAHVGHGGIAPDYEPAEVGSMPALRVQDGKLVQVGTKASTPFYLGGVNVPGLDTRKYNWGKPVEHSSDPADRVEPSTRWYEAAGITAELFTWLHDEWKANVVRIPLNQDWILNGTRVLPDEPRRCYSDPTQVKPSMPGAEYLLDVDKVVGWATKAGLYVILCIAAQRLTEQFPQDNYDPKVFQAQLPDAHTMLAWRVLASRYGRAEAVLFDLFNEPHALDEGSNDYARDRQLYNGPAVPKAQTKGPSSLEDPKVRTWWENIWHDWARILAAVVAASAPDKPVIIGGMGGTNWGASLRALPRVTFWPQKNVLYTSHLYANDAIDDRWADPNPPPAAPGPPRTPDWKQPADEKPEYWLSTRATNGPPEAPIFVGEWGPTEWPWWLGAKDGPWPPGVWDWQATPAQGRKPQKDRTEALRDRLWPEALGGAKEKVASAKLVGWAAWALNGHPRLNRGLRVEVKAEQPRKKPPVKCGRLGEIPVNEIDPNKPAQLPLTPWGTLVHDALRAQKPGPRP